jgi:hypothetical protein
MVTVVTGDDDVRPRDGTNWALVSGVGAVDADSRNLDDGSTDVRVIERQESREDEHFTEGEPDLESPEELAVLEVDEEALFEEDLDNRVDLEDEMDEDVLETSLDHLVHDGDRDEDDDTDAGDGDVAPRSPLSIVAVGAGDTTELEDLEVEDLEDRDESLDRILAQKLAGDEEPVDDPDEGVDLVVTGSAVGGTTVTDRIEVSTCGPDEFVCRVCFLVLSRAQRADGSEATCRDCAL